MDPIGPLFGCLAWSTPPLNPHDVSESLIVAVSVTSEMYTSSITNVLLVITPPLAEPPDEVIWILEMLVRRISTLVPLSAWITPPEATLSRPTDPMSVMRQSRIRTLAPPGELSRIAPPRRERPPVRWRFSRTSSLPATPRSKSRVVRPPSIVTPCPSPTSRTATALSRSIGALAVDNSVPAGRRYPTRRPSHSALIAACSAAALVIVHDGSLDSVSKSQGEGGHGGGEGGGGGNGGDGEKGDGGGGDGRLARHHCRRTRVAPQSWQSVHGAQRELEAATVVPAPGKPSRKCRCHPV